MNKPSLSRPAADQLADTAVIELIPDPPAGGRHRFGCCDSVDGWCAQCSALKQIEQRTAMRALQRLTGIPVATHTRSIS